MHETQLIRFEEWQSANGKIGVICLDNPKALNSLTLEMFRALNSQLMKWKYQKDLSFVWMHSSLEKAFSAGGDVKTLALRVIENPSSEFAEEFFWWEYATDHLLHAFPKPILSWLDGITMGGGIGISNGASHRIATERTLFAMPETAIGFFPDVGAAWFLNRLPFEIALFVAWTGARLDGFDGASLGLADQVIRSAEKERVIEACLKTHWSSDPLEVRNQISALLAPFSEPKLDSSLAQVRNEIHITMATDSASQAFESLLEWKPDNPWVLACLESLRKACPLSLFVTFEHFRRCKGLALKEVFKKDWSLAVKMSRHHDFKEGIRAVLIEKDQKPKWQPSKISEVNSRTVHSLLEPHPKEEDFFRFILSQVN